MRCLPRDPADSGSRRPRPAGAVAGRCALALLGLVALSACGPGLAPVIPAPAPEAAPAAPDTAAPARGGGAMAEKVLIVPVEGVHPSRVRDNYSASRGARTHNALDIMAPRGTPVLAADDGRILRLSTNPAGGITIYQLAADEQFVYYYAHLQKYRDGLRDGMDVRQGDVIGYVGTTGNAPPDVPHLHFQVMRYRRDGRYWAGEPVNPHPFLVRQADAGRGAR
ncbi:MAG TPA: M23 family metallopeptidase [Gemmatimonadaceae bacterium]|nr:M23 family metallopeptidase [Gemmatimonadaceae bacterium]